jgi:aspartyl protease family protein
VNRTFALVILIVCAAALAVIITPFDPDQIGSFLDTQDMLVLGRKIIWAIIIGGIMLLMFRGRLWRAAEALVFWMLLAALLGVGYTYRHELRDVADRVLAELMPGRAATHGDLVEIVRPHGGEFTINAHINDMRVPMILDTGASRVVLTAEAARAAGLPTEFLAYSIRVDTANGHTQAAPVTLDRISIGGITERAVPALIAQPGQLKTSLLGMSFLNRLESWEVRGTKLMLRAARAGS